MSDDCAPDCAARTHCTIVGKPGHWQCGSCPVHGKPRHHCGCICATDRESAEEAIEFFTLPEQGRSYNYCSCAWSDGKIVFRGAECQVHFSNTSGVSMIMNHVGFGNKDRQIVADFNLGYGIFRAPDRGFRRAFWDMCFGYVSGFRKRDIFYFILTRSFRK